MIQRLALTLAAVFFSAASLLHAQAPAGSTGQCKDGTYSTAASKSGACRGHQGVQTWFAASATPAKSASAKSATATAAPKTAAPAAAVKPAAMPATASGAAPSGASGQCNDGTYSNAASKSGACRGHQGVKTWFAASAAPAAKSSPAPVAAAAPAPRPAPAPAPAPRPAPVAAAAPAPQPAPAQPARTQPAAGGGNGQVWVNTATKVYHCSNDRYYGKTKQGAYMSQGDAQAKGYRPDAGKVCPN